MLKSLRTVSLLVPCIATAAFAQDQAPTIDKGDTAWLLISSALVLLMTLPGLALFYGGLAKKKDTLNVMAMSFVTLAIVSILWILFGYTFSFSGDIGGFIGDAQKLLLNGVTTSSVSGSIPEFVFIMFQLTFAAITVALAGGAYVERMKFSAWILFSVLWFALAYIPMAHWVWGGGFLAKMGALDFAGGTVVHINAGIAALIGALVMGKRHNTDLMPNNLVSTVAGTGLLWFGWFGFNAGSALAADGLAGAAFINTNTASAAAALAWMVAEWIHSKKPTVLGLCSGAVAGLVTITPAAGFVNIGGALIIGILAGVVTFIMVAFVKAKLGYDDTLDAFGIHGIGGILGAILTGVFADPAINKLGVGLLYGNPHQLVVQLIATLVSIVWVALITWIVFMIIKYTVGLRANADEEYVGMDKCEHGEKAYNI
jgi:Amt family ammonium transporter